MPPDENPPGASAAGFPWYMIWVLGALALAYFNATEFRATGRPGSAVVTIAWLLFAFSWYARPFRVSFRARPSQAFAQQPLRAWVSPALWNLATLAGLVLLVIGIFLKFTQAA